VDDARLSAAYDEDMPVRPQLAVAGVLLALLVGGFLWRYGDSTGPVDTGSTAGQEVTTGWHRVDALRLDPVSRELRGIAGASGGIPRQGTYLVNLWYSSCGPCKHELPWLERFSRTGKVKIIGVTRDNREKYAVEAIQRYGLTYPNLWDPLADFWDSLGSVIAAQWAPNTIVVVDGKVSWAHIGPFKSYADLRDSVTRRL